MKKLIARMAKGLEGKFQKHQTKLKAGDKAPEIKGMLHDGTPFDKNSVK